MDWLIDGYNLLISNDLGHDEASRGRFRSRIAGHFSGKQVRVSVVYDSKNSLTIQRERITGNLTEIYVSNADQYLIDTVERHPHPRSIVLVTDDREIMALVGKSRPQHMSTAAFLSLIASPAVHRPPGPEKPERDTPENIQRYLRIFTENGP